MKNFIKDFFSQFANMLEVVDGDSSWTNVVEGMTVFSGAVEGNAGCRHASVM